MRLVYVKADYTKVNAALEKAMALDPSDYQDFSAVKEAIDKVIFDLDITKQKQVDAMAEAIFHAIDQLKGKRGRCTDCSTAFTDHTASAKYV